MNLLSHCWFKAVAGLLLLGLVPGTGAAPAPKKVLVVTVTVGFRHSSIPLAEKVLTDLGRRSGAFTVVDLAQSPPRPANPRPPAPPQNNADPAQLARFQAAAEKFKAAQERFPAELAAWEKTVRAELAEKMSPAALAQYDGVIFANTTGDLPLPDKAAFMDWLKSGKAFIGMHSATDTFHGFPDFIEMIGGEFRTHHEQVKVDALNESPRHPATRHLGSVYSLLDEIYLLKNFYRGRVHGLLWLDQHPNFKVPGDYPIAWSKTYGNGKVFYTALGHREDVWESELYQQHILGGIKWALGLEPADATPQNRRYEVSAAEKSEGFFALFNGVDLHGWKLRHADGRQSWSAQNGMLVNEISDTTALVDRRPQKRPGTDLITTEKFKDFTLRYEYMIAPGSNSGVYLRGRHEIQIFDDYEKGQPALGGNGAIYNLAAPAQFASRPPGQWQEVEATIVGDRVTVILNGKRIHDNVRVDRATGGEIDAAIGMPGPIMLQGDHGDVAFRNVRLKLLR